MAKPSIGKNQEEPPLPDLADIFGRTWYVAQVASGRERVVAQYMRDHGHGAIVPTVQRFRFVNRYSKRKDPVYYPIMPRYVIIGFAPDAPRPWRDLYDLSFVHAVVEDARGPARVVRTQLVKFIKDLDGATWSAEEWERYMRSGHEFRPGDEVDVIDGVFREHRLRVEDIEGDMAKVLVKLFEIERPYMVPLAFLQKAE